MSETSILGMIANTGGMIDVTPEPVNPVPKPGVKVRLRIEAEHIKGNLKGVLLTAGVVHRVEEQKCVDPQDVNRCWREPVIWVHEIPNCPFFLRCEWDDGIALCYYRPRRAEYKQDAELKAWLESNTVFQEQP